MLENYLERTNLQSGKKISVKAAVTVGLICLAVILPQIAHLAVGPSAGMTLLPMYLPALLGGCLLGAKWGLFTGILSPLASFAVTSAFGSAMPAAARLPFMMAELAVFALVSGLFSNKIAKNALFAFPSFIAAEISGRGFFLLSVAALQGVTPLKTAVIWQQIQTGFVGLAVQAVLVPLMVIAIKKIMDKEAK